VSERGFRWGKVGRVGVEEERGGGPGRGEPSVRKRILGRKKKVHGVEKSTLSSGDKAFQRGGEKRHNCLRLTLWGYRVIRTMLQEFHL